MDEVMLSDRFTCYGLVLSGDDELEGANQSYPQKSTSLKVFFGVYVIPLLINTHGCFFHAASRANPVL